METISSDEYLDNHGGSTCQSLQVSSIFFCNHWVGFKEHRNSLVFAMKYGRLLGKVSPSDFELRINSSMCLCMAFLQAMWRVWTREKMDIYIYMYIYICRPSKPLFFKGPKSKNAPICPIWPFGILKAMRQIKVCCWAHVLPFWKIYFYSVLPWL